MKKFSLMRLCCRKYPFKFEGYRFAEESAFKFGTSRLRDQGQDKYKIEFFASTGVRECYDSLLERNLIDDQPLLCEIVEDLAQAY